MYYQLAYNLVLRKDRLVARLKDKENIVSCLLLIFMTTIVKMKNTRRLINHFNDEMKTVIILGIFE